MNRRFRYLISGACALLAIVLCLAYGEQVRLQCERERTEALERYGGEVVRLVVATETIEAGETIDANNATERDWVAELAPAGSLTELASVEGAQVSVPVAAGMPVTELNLRDPSEAIEVPSGMVALAISAGSDTGVPQGLEVGATLAAYEVGAEGVRLIADDLRVLMAPTGASGVLASRQLTIGADPDDVAPLVLPGEDALVKGGEGSFDPDNVVPQTPSSEGEGVPAEGGDSRSGEKGDVEGGGAS